MNLPNPMECAENNAEAYAFDNSDDDNIRCAGCKKMVPIAECSAGSPHPCALPICRACTEGEVEQLRNAAVAVIDEWDKDGPELPKGMATKLASLRRAAGLKTSSHETEDKDEPQNAAHK